MPKSRFLVPDINPPEEKLNFDLKKKSLNWTPIITELDNNEIKNKAA